MILAERQARIEAEAAAALARDTASRLDAEALQLKAAASPTDAMIAHLKLQIERLRRELYGQRSERTARLVDQMELQLEELEAKTTEDEMAAEAGPRQVAPLMQAQRRHSVRKPFPEHLPRERMLVPAPASCPCCGLMKLAKLGEDVTETLEVVPRSWRVIQTVREKFTCRACEAITRRRPCRRNGDAHHHRETERRRPQAWLADALAASRRRNRASSESCCPGTGAAPRSNTAAQRNRRSSSPDAFAVSPWPSPEAYVEEAAELAQAAVASSFANVFDFNFREIAEFSAAHDLLQKGGEWAVASHGRRREPN